MENRQAKRGPPPSADEPDAKQLPSSQSSQSAVHRRRRPLKLTQPSEQRRKPAAAAAVAAAATAAEPAPCARKLAHPLPPPPPRPAVGARGRQSEDAEAAVCLSQDAERVYWSAESSAEKAQRAPDLRAARDTAVVRSSEPAQDQDALFEYWLSTSAAKPALRGGPPAAVDEQPERQDKKALLFGHLAELQRRGRPGIAPTDEPAPIQSSDQSQPAEASEQMLASLGLSEADLASAFVDDEDLAATVCVQSSATASQGVEAKLGTGSACGEVGSDAASSEAVACSASHQALPACAGDHDHDRSAVVPDTSVDTPTPYAPEVADAEQTCRRLVIETMQSEEGQILRLLDASTGSVSTCEMRGQWASSPVVSGDVVNIVGGRHGSGSEAVIVDQESGYIVQQPDTLVTGTRVAQSFGCQRKVVIGGKLSSSISSIAAMRGTMLHELFEAAVTSRLSTDTEYEEAISNILVASMQTMYAADAEENETRSYLGEHVNLIRSWVHTYLRTESTPADGMAIHSVLQAEENIWSPEFGLKGKVDLSINMRGGRADGDGGHHAVATALELKTGRQYPEEHRAQVMLYSLLMSQRYGVNVDSGILLYLSQKIQEMQTVTNSRASLTGIIMQRNALAVHLRTDKGDRRCTDLPIMIMDEHRCGHCFQKDSCMLYHRAIEGGTAETSGVESLFNAAVSHLTDRHLDYCRSHLQMLDDESADDRTDQHEIWTTGSTTREASGLTLGRLKIESEEPQEGQGGRTTLYRFARQSSTSTTTSSSGPLLLPPTRISPGDYIVVSSEWPRRQTAVSTGFVRAIDDRTVTVSLDPRLRPLAPLAPLAESSLDDDDDGDGDTSDALIWRLDKDDLSTGYNSVRANIVRLFADDAHMTRLRSLIVDLDAPRYTTSQGPDSVGVSVLGGTAGSDPTRRPTFDDLNTEQVRAIDHVLAARDYALILGMPGTGKTTTISRLVQALAAGKKSVLLASFTNAAVDNILLKLKSYGQDFLRIGSANSVHPGVVEHTVEGGFVEHTPASLKQSYESAMIVATTCLGTKHHVFSKRRFDYCIIDEASQISQAMCLGPLCCADVFVLVGDHYQLPPLVRSAAANAKGMSVSLFKRLSETHSQAVHQLCSQYRMNETIMSLSNELVYGGQLRCGTPEIANSMLLLPNWSSYHDGWVKETLAPSSPVVFLDTDTCTATSAEEVRSGDALQNTAEAAIVGELIGGLVALEVSDHMIGVISPYRSQLRVIKAALDKQLQGNPLVDADRVEVNTVDRYQGRDKDCIILSLVRSNLNQAVGELLNNWRRINVAITRAKTKMIFVGSARTLRGSAVFDRLLAALSREGRVHSMPSDWREAVGGRLAERDPKN